MNTPTRLVTLEDVALALGVHKSSVSLALRNRSGVGRELRERIRKKAEEMGYMPDPLLGAFTQQRTRSGADNQVLAVLCGKDSREELELSPLHRELLGGVRAQAVKRGHVLDVFYCGADKFTPARLEGILTARGISKVLLLAPESCAQDWLRNWAKYNALALETVSAAPGVDVIMADYRAAVRTAVHRLAEQGYTRIQLLVTEAEDRRLGELVSAGYVQALHELGFWRGRGAVEGGLFAADAQPGIVAVQGRACRGQAKSGLMICGVVEDYQRIAAAAVDLLALRGEPQSVARQSGRSITYLPLGVRAEGAGPGYEHLVMTGSVLGAFPEAIPFTGRRSEPLSA